MGVFTVPANFPWLISERLTAAGITGEDRRNALAVLSLVLSDLESQSFACRTSLLGLAAALGMDAATTKRAMRALHAVEALTVIVRHKRRMIAVTPPNARQNGRPRQFPPIAPVAAA